MYMRMVSSTLIPLVDKKEAINNGIDAFANTKFNTFAKQCNWIINFVFSIFDRFST